MIIRPRIAVILAGGKSTRFGRDKATAIFDGERLIDRVAARLSAQADRVLISGSSNFGTEFEFVPDAPDAPEGPAAGLYSVARVLELEGAAGFVAAPADGPNPPSDLVARLSRSGGCAVAAQGAQAHPTFAYWSISLLTEVEAKFRTGPTSLMRLAELTGAARVAWSEPGAFDNVNTEDDLTSLVPGIINW